MKKVGKVNESWKTIPDSPKFYPLVSDRLFEGKVKRAKKKIKEDDADLPMNQRGRITQAGRAPKVDPKTYQTYNSMTDWQLPMEGSGGQAKLQRRLKAQDKEVSKSIADNPPFSPKTDAPQKRRVSTAGRLGRKTAEGEGRPLKRAVDKLGEFRADGPGPPAMRRSTDNSRKPRTSPYSTALRKEDESEQGHLRPATQSTIDRATAARRKNPTAWAKNEPDNSSPDTGTRTRLTPKSQERQKQARIAATVLKHKSRVAAQKNPTLKKEATDDRGRTLPGSSADDKSKITIGKFRSQPGAGPGQAARNAAADKAAAAKKPPHKTPPSGKQSPADAEQDAKQRAGLYDAQDDNWIQGAEADIKRRGTKGKCTPITKPGCTGKAKALAKTFKKMAKKKDDSIVSKDERKNEGRLRKRAKNNAS